MQFSSIVLKSAWTDTKRSSAVIKKRNYVGSMFPFLNLIPFDERGQN